MKIEGKSIRDINGLEACFRMKEEDNSDSNVNDLEVSDAQEGCSNAKRALKRFLCRWCSSKFTSRSDLIPHYYESHNRGFKCVICGNCFSSFRTFFTHVSSHKGETLQCCRCEFSSGNLKNYKDHFIKKKCKQIGKRDGGLEENKVNKRKEECRLCKMKFSLPNQLLVHSNKEHGAVIACNLCHQVFNSVVSLRSHKSIKHTGKDKICEICGYSTKKTYDFKRHQVKHNSKYTITCSLCNKGFFSPYEFNEHKNVHTAQRPYQCELCGVDYSRRSSLILHRNRKHPESFDSSKRCSVCNQVCLTKETMAAHMRSHVEGRKRFYCDLCGKGLLSRVNLKIHRRGHTGEKPYDCHHCGRAFSCKKNLSVHTRLHTGERPYSCKLCWKSYTKSSALKVHEKVHCERQINL